MKVWVRISTKVMPGLAGLGALLMLSAASAGEPLDGFWMDSDGEVIVEVKQCGADRCATVAWLKQPLGLDGGPLRDYRNPDPALQQRFVCGLNVISGFVKQEDGTFDNGTVYVPDEGKTVSGAAKILDASHIEVRGYVGLKIFGETEVWSRVTAPPRRCTADLPKQAGSAPPNPAAAAAPAAPKPAAPKRAAPTP